MRAEVIGETWAGVNDVKIPVIGTKDPLEKLGTVVATVARRFVPKFSAEIVTNTVQNPLPKPIIQIIKYIAVFEAPLINKRYTKTKKSEKDMKAVTAFFLDFKY
jgi:hypothetical protein